MKRSPLARKTPLRSKPPARVERERAPLVLVPRPSDAPRAVMALAKANPTSPVPPRIEGRRDQRIRDSARGEECEIRLPGCSGGGESTVWCHLPEAVAGRGLGLKGIDLLGAYGCFHCHNVVDRRAPRPANLTEHDVALMFYRAMARSIVKLARKGVV